MCEELARYNSNLFVPFVDCTYKNKHCEGNTGGNLPNSVK